MKLKVNNDCAACSYCYRYCPVGAPYSDGLQTQIDQEKCISCGICMKKCPMGAIYDEENPPKPMPPHEKLHYDADAVIVGAGASGMVAAVRLAEQGKRVIVLEKAKNTGAAGLHVAGPMQIIDTKWALDAGEKPKAPDKIREILEYSAGRHDPELIEKTVYALPRLFDWMCTFTDMSEGFVLREGRMGPPPMPGGEGEMPPPPGMGEGDEKPESIQAGGGMPGSAMGGNDGLIVESKDFKPGVPMFHNSGEFILTRLYQRAEELGVVILRETAAKQLLKAADGTFTGVLASDPGGEVEVCGKVILIATGSLLLNQEVIEHVAPDFADSEQPKYGHTINTYTGDGFEMCKDAGIPVNYDDVWLNITGAVVMPADALTVEYSEATGKKPMMPADMRAHANRPECLTINDRGERFQDERWVCVDIRNQMKQPHCIAYNIFTEELIKRKPMKWIPLRDEQGKPLRTLLPMGMFDGQAWNEEHIQTLLHMKDKHLVKADTIAELAEKLGCKVGTLETTVARYNALCAAGQDEDFGKPADYLISLEHGPFYAVRTFLMSDGIEGGIPISSSCEVMGDNGPIQNLFAAGDNSSGNIVKLSQTEKMWITNEFSWALSSGMIAADGMLEALS